MPFLHRDKLKRAPTTPTTSGRESRQDLRGILFFRVPPPPPAFLDLFILLDLRLRDLDLRILKELAVVFAYCLRKRLKNGMLWRSMAS